MERLSIIERTCGCPLYDQIWSWKADERSPSTPCQLIQFFYQFSKDMGGGAVQRICFETSSEEKLQPKRGAYPRYGVSTHPRSNRHKSINQVPHTRALEMYVAHNEQIIATIFVNREYDKSCDKILHQILTEFTTHYSDIMIALMPQFINQSKHPDDAALNITFMSKFATFGDIITKYAWNHNSSRTSHAMQQGQPSDRVGVGSLEGIGGDADGASIRIHASRQQDDDADDLTTRHAATVIDEDEEDTGEQLKTTTTTSSQPSPHLTATTTTTGTATGTMSAIDSMTAPNQSNSSQATLLIRAPSGERITNNLSTTSTATATSAAATLLPAPRPTAARTRQSRASKSRPTPSSTPSPALTTTAHHNNNNSNTPTLTVPNSSSSDDFTFASFDTDDTKDARGRTTTHTRYQISPSQSPPQLHTTLSAHPKDGRSSSVSMSLMNGIHPQVRASSHDEDDADGYG